MGKRAEARTADITKIRKDLQLPRGERRNLLWSDSVGAPPYTVSVQERWKHGTLKVYTRHQTEDGRRPYLLTETASIRDDRGRPVTRLKDAALAEARDLYEKLAGLSTPTNVKPSLKRLTLAAGVECAFGKDGHWDDKPGTWDRDVRRYLTAMVELLHKHADPTAQTEPLHYDEITPGMLKGSMRTLADDGADNRKGQGLERATKMYRTFFALCKWLTGEYPDLRFPAELYQWKETLREIWEKKTGRDLELEEEQEKPRHTVEEMVKLYGALDEDGVDRRLALLLRIGGGEQRMGQVRATMRSRVDLSEGAGIGYGVVRPRGRKRKKASPIFLTAEERAFLDLAMEEGYLRKLEAAYKDGHIKDYPLFCSGKLRHPRRYFKDEKKELHDKSVPGFIPLDRKSYTPIDKGTLNAHFHELERIAGVRWVRGRGWYGIRRLTSDLFQELGEQMEGVTPEVLNLAQGWDKNSNVRGIIYQKKERTKALAKAAELRQRARELGLERSEDEALLHEPVELIEDAGREAVD